MKLVAGSYERYLWGWRVEKKKGELRPIFSYPAHLGPIKCISSWGTVLATGGSDDTIKIFDTNAQRDMGTLIQHAGAVTTLGFYGSVDTPSYPTNLISGSEDGTLCIWDTEAWILYKTMKGHKKGVSSLSIHPSGRLCLSVGRDSQLNMYDLLKGRRSFTNKLPSEASIVLFSPHDGDAYSLCSDNVVSVHSSHDGRLLHTLMHPKRVLCLVQQQDNLLLTGGEDRNVNAWDMRTGKIAFSVENAHSNRIRGLGVSDIDKTSEDIPFYIASASSDGCVRVWDSRMVGKSDKAVMEVETKARLTCLATCSLKRRNQKNDVNSGDEKMISTDDHTSPIEIKKVENGTKRSAAETEQMLSSDDHISPKEKNEAGFQKSKTRK